MGDLLRNTRRALLGVRKNRYLFDDEFRDALAAGAVNGTASTPGPGTRVVVDTDNKLTVGGGSVNLAPHSVLAWGDPALILGAVTRTAGRIGIFQVTPADNGSFSVGFGDNAGAADTTRWESSMYFNAAVVRHTGSGASPDVDVGPYVATNAYIVAIVLRANGDYFFFKGGIYTNWTYMGTIQDSALGTLYPYIAVRSGTMTSAFLRVPFALWLPSSIYDSFTRANGALGSTETLGPDSQSISQKVWTNQVGTTLVAGNAASASALVGGIAIATVTGTTPDVVIRAPLTRNGGDCGVVLRYTDSNNYVIAYHDGANANLDKVVGGVTTSMISIAAGYAAGRIIEISCQGTSFELRYNNAKIGATQTIADAGVQNGTECGVYSTDVTNSQADILIMPRGSSGEYSRLNRWSRAQP